MISFGEIMIKIRNGFLDSEICTTVYVRIPRTFYAVSIHDVKGLISTEISTGRMTSPNTPSQWSVFEGAKNLRSPNAARCSTIMPHATALLTCGEALLCFLSGCKHHLQRERLDMEEEVGEIEAMLKSIARIPRIVCHGRSYMHDRQTLFLTHISVIFGFSIPVSLSILYILFKLQNNPIPSTNNLLIIPCLLILPHLELIFHPHRLNVYICLPIRSIGTISIHSPPPSAVCDQLIFLKYTVARFFPFLSNTDLFALAPLQACPLNDC